MLMGIVKPCIAEDRYVFQNRREAGKVLAREVAKLKPVNPVVLAVPRGGIEVAYEVAAALEAPLDIIIARKIGAPFEPELAIGAVVDGDHPETVLNREVMDLYDITDDYLELAVKKELKEIDRRQILYRNGRDPIPLEGATVILVDDGIATGASIRAAIRGLRRRPIDSLVLAIPVAPPSTIESLTNEVDEIICLESPDSFFAVGAFFADFRQTTDDIVVDLLEKARRWYPRPAGINPSRK